MLLFSVSAHAAYDGAWLNNDGNVNFGPYGLATEYSLFLYDFGDSSMDMEILPAGSTLGETVYFGLFDEMWYATLLELPGAQPADFIMGDDSVLLGEDSNFGLYLADSTGNVIGYDYTAFDPGRMYMINPVSSASILVVDAYPATSEQHETPLPAAAWLLGAGLAGIYGFRRKLFR
jgi:hypothetical protein